MTDKNEIVAFAALTREDVERVGSTLKLVYKLDNAAGFEELLSALDTAEPYEPLSH